MVSLGRRVTVIGALFLLMAGGLGARLWNLQLTKGKALAREALAQRRLALPLSEARGQIVDRNGVSLLDSQPAWGVAAFPPLVDHRGLTARALAPVLNEQEEELAARLQGRSPVWLGLPVSAAVAAEVEKMRLPGIVAAPAGQRYGNQSLARHLVGYINEQGGMLGLEAMLERELAGEAAPALTAYLDGKGRPMGGIGVRTLQGDGKPPYHIHTTLDARIQRAVELVLDSRNPLRAGVVVMDPETGDLLAMASRPNYNQMLDPGRRVDDGLAFLLDRTTMALEPGSVLKPMVAAAGLEAGVIKPEERVYCPGHYDMGGGYRPACAVTGGHGMVSLKEAIERSCNVYFMKLGVERLGSAGLRRMLADYGFGLEPLLGLPGEQGTSLPPFRLPYQTAQVSFGQGMTTSPLQIARAFAAIANGGTLPPARVVRAVRAPDQTVMRRPAVEGAQRVMAPETARLIQQALAAVTDPKGQGTGRRAWVPVHGSAGKTGSAEGLDRGERALHAWFAGYTPLHNPRYVIVVMVQAGGAGGEVAAPLFSEVARAIHASVPPGR